LTDFWHHWNPALPALLAGRSCSPPASGCSRGASFERNFAWSNFFVLASSLSLAGALGTSGASAWIADLIVRSIPGLSQHPFLVVGILLLVSAPVRLMIPNITGFLATAIPIAMSVGTATGLNPVVCALAVMIAGDAVLYYPAQAASSLVVYERGHLSSWEIFRFGLWMTLIAFLVILVFAFPYWGMVGAPLRLPLGR